MNERFKTVRNEPGAVGCHVESTRKRVDIRRNVHRTGFEKTLFSVKNIYRRTPYSRDERIAISVVLILIFVDQTENFKAKVNKIYGTLKLNIARSVVVGKRVKNETVCHVGESFSFERKTNRSDTSSIRKVNFRKHYTRY